MNPAPFRKMIPRVTTGKRRLGISSFSGNIEGQAAQALRTAPAQTAVLPRACLLATENSESTEATARRSRKQTGRGPSRSAAPGCDHAPVDSGDLGSDDALRTETV